MAVDDHGLETLKKAAEQVIPGNKTSYYYKVNTLKSGIIKGIATEETLQLAVNAIETFEGFTVRYPTYSACITGLTVATAATDFFTIVGATGKLIVITEISIVGNKNTNGTVDVTLLERSTLNTGGTFTTLVNVPHLSTDAPASATVKAYTVNPATLGTLVGPIRAKKVFLSSGSSYTDGGAIVFGFLTKPIYLVSNTEKLCLNFNGQTAAGNSLNISATWFEVTL